MKITVKCHKYSQPYYFETKESYEAMLQALKDLQKHECNNYIIIDNEGVKHEKTIH